MIVVNQEDCIKCGACEGTCPSSAICLINNQIVFCDLCDDKPKCVEICPNNALKVDSIIVDNKGNTQVRLVFNSTLCDNCDGEFKCVEICPQNTLKLSDKRESIEGFCVMCQQCVNICPPSIIGVSGVKKPVKRELDIRYYWTCLY